MLFKLDIEMWNAVRQQRKQGELLIAVTEDQTLKTYGINTAVPN